jgi:hypothetical protein
MALLSFFEVRMQYEWSKKLHKLETLVNHVEEFLRKKNYTVETISQDDARKTIILALPSEKSVVGQAIRVEVSETVNGTAVDFVSTSRADESMRLGMIAQFLVGGALMAKNVNVKEKLEALETEFWSSIQEFISSQPGQLT